MGGQVSLNVLARPSLNPAEVGKGRFAWLDRLRIQQDLAPRRVRGLCLWRRRILTISMHSPVAERIVEQPIVPSTIKLRSEIILAFVPKAAISRADLVGPDRADHVGLVPPASAVLLIACAVGTRRARSSEAFGQMTGTVGKADSRRSRLSDEPRPRAGTADRNFSACAWSVLERGNAGDWRVSSMVL